MKNKILFALAILLVLSSIWAVGNLRKTNRKECAYTNQDVWAAYEGFNNILLDSDAFISCTKLERIYNLNR